MSSVTWREDEFTPRVDRAATGASPHQQILRVDHPDWFREGDIVRVGEDRLVGTGKFFYGREEMRALNESVRVTEVRDDRRLVLQRGVGANPPQRIRRGDRLLIIAASH